MLPQGGAPLHRIVRTETSLAPLEAILEDPECVHLIDARDAEGRTPLALAGLAGKYDYVEALLLAGADPDITTPDPDAPAASDQPDEVEGTQWKLTLLQWACRAPDERLFSLLLRFQPDPFAEAEAYPWRTALGALVAGRQLGLARRLIEAHRDMADLLINQHPFVLLETVRADLSEFLQYLLQFEVDTNVTDAEGNGPLHLAAMQGGRRCVELLLQAGADVHLKDAQGRTTHFAAVPRHLAVARILTDDDPRAVRSLVDASGRSLLHALFLDVAQAEDLPLTDDFADEFRSFVRHLHALRCPITTKRRLMFGVGELSVFEELAAVAPALIPPVRLVLDETLRVPEWRALLDATLDQFSAGVRQYVTDHDAAGGPG